MGTDLRPGAIFSTHRKPVVLRGWVAPRELAPPQVWRRSPATAPNRLGFGLAHGLGRGGPAFGFVQHFVREFVNQGAEFFCASLPWEQRDSASVAHAECRCDRLLELDLDSLRDGEVEQPFAVLAHVAAHLGCKLGKFFAFRLRDIEDVHGTEAYEDGLILSADVLLGFGVWLAPGTDHGSKDADAALTLFHSPAKLIPSVHSSHAGCVGALPGDLKDVAKGVVVKSAHRREVGGQPLRVSGLKLLDQKLDVGGNDFFRRLRRAERVRGSGRLLWWWLTSSWGLLLALEWLCCVCSQTRLGPGPRQRGRQVQRCGKSGPWASRRPEEANTWSCTELFPSPCARQEQRSSARFGFLAGRGERMNCF